MQTKPYDAYFRQAAGSKARFVGKLGETKLQLHDSLEAIVDGIRVMDSEDNNLQCILGTDLFDPRGEILKERSTMVKQGVKTVVVEVGNSGVLVEIPTVRANGDGALIAAVHEEDWEGGDGELTVIPMIPHDVAEATYLLDPSQLPPLTAFASNNNLHLGEALHAMKIALKAGHSVMSKECPKCNHAHCSSGKEPTRSHVCPKCDEPIVLPIPAVCNPLIWLQPVMDDDQLYFCNLAPYFRGLH